LFIIGVTSYFSNGNVINKVDDLDGEQKNQLLEFRVWLPYLIVFFLFLFMVFKETKFNSIAIGLVISVSLIIFRQIFMNIQNNQLLARLTVLNKELENKVQLRTKELSERNKQLKESLSQVEFLAYKDTLTGLPNRVSFERYLSQLLIDSKDNKTKVAILYLDLDRFKVINDTLNHLIGDLLLQQVAKRLKDCMQERGVICRQGGDEFFIVLPDADNIFASIYAEKILDSLSSVYLVEGHELFVSASIGISIFPDQGNSVEELVRSADVALYAIKNQGKNNYKLFIPEIEEGFTKRLTIENGLRKAIEKDEFILYYQPKLQLKTNKIVGMEALIRWNHPKEGIISPGLFIPVAEETGLINRIGKWVLKTACEQTKRWQEEGLKDISVSVNVSAIQFKQKDICKQVEEALVMTGLDPEYLILEVTESIMQNVMEASVVLQELKSLGVQISLDDFGSGFSSLTQIKHLPLDILKIDKSFIDDLVCSARDQAIVKTIIELGKNLGLRIVAEGVESVQQLEYLRENGCDLIQGFFLAQPLPKHEFGKKIKSCN
ncbi:MAG: EAL domain-containing protein, partial [Bacillota bacterium]|nr:EAL domain-containing protein [Bacillota bacterium]